MLKHRSPCKTTHILKVLQVDLTKSTGRLINMTHTFVITRQRVKSTCDFRFFTRQPMFRLGVPAGTRPAPSLLVDAWVPNRIADVNVGLVGPELDAGAEDDRGARWVHTAVDALRLPVLLERRGEVGHVRVDGNGIGPR